MQRRSRAVALAAVLTIGAGLTDARAQNREEQRPGATVTVVGCVQRPEASGSLGGAPLGTSPTPNAADERANSSLPEPGFILAGAKPEATVPNSGDGPAASSAREAPMTYALDWNAAELAKHVGHRVAITGVVAEPVDPQRPVASPDPVASQHTGHDPAGKPFQSGVRQLRVASLKMIAGTCAER